RLQIDHLAAQVLLILSRGAVEDRTGVLADQLDAGGRVYPAADQERGPRVRHRKRDGGEGALCLVAVDLVAADPVLALVLAPHVAAALDDGIALDRLSLESVALGGPVL